MWLAIHDGAGWSYYLSGTIAQENDKAYLSQRQDAAAGTQTAEPLVILTACLFSLAAGENKKQVPATTLIATVGGKYC